MVNRADHAWLVYLSLYICSTLPVSSFSPSVLNTNPFYSQYLRPRSLREPVSWPPSESGQMEAMPLSGVDGLFMHPNAGVGVEYLALAGLSCFPSLSRIQVIAKMVPGPVDYFSAAIVVAPNLAALTLELIQDMIISSELTVPSMAKAANCNECTIRRLRSNLR